MLPGASPVPTSPSEFHPQQYAAPSAVHAQVWNSPADIPTKATPVATRAGVMAQGPSAHTPAAALPRISPALDPQQYAAPLRTTAQLCRYPAPTDTAGSSSGTRVGLWR